MNDLAQDLQALQLVTAPDAVALAALAAGVRLDANCSALATSIGKEVSGHLDGTGNRYLRTVRFSPHLTADLALAAIAHSLLPGRVHVVYELKGFSCQQAIFMGPEIAKLYGNPDLGAFVELTSGKGVGYGKYDADRVNKARITPLGRRGGQPCT